MQYREEMFHKRDENVSEHFYGHLCDQNKGVAAEANNKQMLMSSNHVANKEKRNSLTTKKLAPITSVEMNSHHTKNQLLSPK
jgi:hypothetical protein